MRQKFVFTTAMAVCIALALVPAVASERTVDRYGDRTKAAKSERGSQAVSDYNKDMAQRPDSFRAPAVGRSATEKARGMVAAATKMEPAEAAFALHRVMRMDLPNTPEADKVLAAAHEMMAATYRAAPSKQVIHLGLSLQYTADPARRSRIEREITELGGDVFNIAFRPNNAVPSTRQVGMSCPESIPVTLPHSEVMSIVNPGDQEWRNFDIPAGVDGAQVRAETISDFPGSFTDDTTLGIWNGCPEIGGTEIYFNDDKGTDFTSLILTDCLVPGTYYVDVGGWFDVATPDNFTLEIEIFATCIVPLPDAFEPDDNREQAGPIGHPTSIPQNANGWGRAKKEYQARTILPHEVDGIITETDHAVVSLTRNELVRAGTAGQYGTFFNGFESSDPTDNPDTVIEMYFSNEADYGGRCNQQDLGFLPVCMTDDDCPDPLDNPQPGFPPCIPIQFLVGNTGFENDIVFNDDRDTDGGDYGSELLVCFPRTASGSTSLSVEFLDADFLVRVFAFSPGDFFDYELQVKNEVACTFEVEPNGTLDPEIANPYAIGDVVAAYFDFAATTPYSDDDVYRWDVDQEELVTIWTTAPDINQSDTGFELYVGPDDAGEYFFTGITDDDGGEGFLSSISVIVPPATDLLENVTADADYYLNVTSFWFNPTYYYELRSEFPAPPTGETEPNDTCDTANAVELGDTVEAAIDPACDYDSYKLTLAENTFVTLTVDSLGDPAMELRDCADDSLLACDDDSAGALLPLIDGCLPPGEYCARIRAFSGFATFNYDLSVDGVAGCAPTDPPDMSGDGAFTCLDFDTCP
jgi:hypothetical protein